MGWTWGTRRARWAAAAALLALSCAGPPGGRDRDEGYLRRVAFEMPGNESVVLRWPERRMPLRVHLPRPPEGLFEEPRAIHEVVRDGVLDWSDAAAPGVPAFEFVDDPGEADIPIVWAAEPTGDWYIAYCIYDIHVFQRRFGVARILVTARWGDGSVADMHDVYGAVLHEMGHALGLGGHSTDRGDVMYSREHYIEGPSERDRATLRALYARPIGSRILGARGR